MVSGLFPFIIEAFCL